MSQPNSKSPWISIVLVVAAIGLGLLIWFGRTGVKGTRLKVTDVESVYYSGDTTEAEAKALGTALEAIHYFDGSSEKDVLVRKEEGATVISFVLQDDKWDDAEIVSAFGTIGPQIVHAVGGPPITLDLIDDRLKSQKSMKVEMAESVLKVTDVESVHYFTSTTEENARRLGEALKANGFFDGTSEKDVFLSQGDAGKIVSFTVQTGAWENASILEAFQTIGEQIAPSLGGPPLTLELIDTKRKPRHSLTIE